MGLGEKILDAIAMTHELTFGALFMRGVLKKQIHGAERGCVACDAEWT